MADEDRERVCLTANMESAKTLSVMVAAIYNAPHKTRDKMVHATCTISAIGWRFCVENQAKSMQGVVFLKKDMFTSFDFVEVESMKEVKFKVNLGNFLDCLHVFGTSCLGTTKLDVSYGVDSGCLRLMLTEQGVLTECSLVTIDAAEELDFQALFRASSMVNRAALHSSHLREAFSELSDLPGAANISLFMAPRAPYFRLASAGSSGSYTVDFPEGSQSFEFFNSTAEQHFEYHLSLMQSAVRALSSAKETWFRVNEEGILAIYHKIVSDDGQTAFASFIILPDSIDDDEEEELDGAEPDV